MKTKISSSFATGALLLGVAALVNVGCSSDSNATPPVHVQPLPDSGAGGSGGGTGAGGTGNGGAGTGATSGTGATPGSGGGTNEPHVDGGVPDGGDAGDVTHPTCVTQTGTNGCISACPKTPMDYLNQCTAAGVCQTFDNATRLGATLWNNGNLVPLTP